MEPLERTVRTLRDETGLVNGAQRKRERERKTNFKYEQKDGFEIRIRGVLFCLCLGDVMTL